MPELKAHAMELGGSRSRIPSYMYFLKDIPVILNDFCPRRFLIKDSMASFEFRLNWRIFLIKDVTVISFLTKIVIGWKYLGMNISEFRLKFQMPSNGILNSKYRFRTKIQMTMIPLSFLFFFL